MSHRLCMIIQKEIEKGINKKENVFELINNKSMSFEMKNGCFLYHTWILIQRLKSENFHWRIFSRSSTGIVYFPFQEFELKCLYVYNYATILCPLWMIYFPYSCFSYFWLQKMSVRHFIHISLSYMTSDIRFI